MRDGTYDLFKGSSQEDALWLGTVDGLQAATDLMRCLALTAPGDYFLFHSGNIVASTAKTPNALRPDTPLRWKIVIISSDSSHVSILTDMLKRQELESISTSTLGQYRDLLATQPVELVFCDQDLPDGTYKDVVSVSRSVGSKARVVVTSRRAHWPEFLEAMDAGAFDVICTPCRSKDVEWMLIQAKRDDRKMAQEQVTSDERNSARGAV